MLSIAKAFTETVHTDHPVILLDEPTAGLEEDGRDLLFDRIDDLRDHASFVFVSHELDEVLEINHRRGCQPKAIRVSVVLEDDPENFVVEPGLIGAFPDLYPP